MTPPTGPDYRAIFARVWREDASQPGYHVMDVGVVGSRALRRAMIALKDAFCEVVPFHYTWLTRFDQQVTGTFHRDGGPAENLLVLGYEPSEVRSVLSIADHPAYTAGAEMPADRVYVVPPFAADRAYIVVLDNSPGRGVWHKAEVSHPDPTKRRVINSIQLGRGRPAADQSAMEAAWLARDDWD